MTRLDRIKKLIDIDKGLDFVYKARDAADAVEVILDSPKTDDEKVVAIFEACLKRGLYDELDIAEIEEDVKK